MGYKTFILLSQHLYNVSMDIYVKMARDNLTELSYFITKCA
jgi:hypothetical protein